MNIQFHALPEELLGFIKNWSKRFNLNVSAGRLFPEFVAEEVSDLDKDEQIEGADFIYLGLSPPNLEATSSYDFLSKNPNYLSIYLGKLDKEGLRESSVSGITTNSEELEIWKKIAREIKKETSTGLWAVNPVLMTKGFYKNARYTQGAYNLAKGKTKLLPAAGWNYYTIEEPDLTSQ